MIRIRRIPMSDPLYTQAVDLRTRVLLAPIGMTIEDYYRHADGAEERCEQFVAVFDHPTGDRVVGTATMLPPAEPDGLAKVSQVCVDPQRQNEGIGQKLMAAIEARAFGELGLAGLYCHAQLVAVPFYERIGWSGASEVFIEAGIKHRKMTVRAPAMGEPVDPELEFELD